MLNPTDPVQIGRYRIEEVIGRGAMGVIYRAHDPVIDRPVALKLVRADLLEGEDRADYMARFQREARAAGRCTHPNIVAVYDFAVHEGNPFIAMEYVDGQSLAQLLQRHGRLPRDRAVAIVRQVLDALGSAHSQGIVHRDIKPANILLTGDGRVKVTDFGISRVGTSTLTQSGAMIGTPSYMSPEQFRGGEVDLRSDLFSTAAVLYELLTGDRPFAGRTFEEIAHRLFHEPPPPLNSKLPDAPAGLTSFLDTALAKTPDQRFGSATVMSQALDGALHAVGTPAWAPGGMAVPPAPAGPNVGAAATGGDNASVALIERKLAEYVGPIARHLVKEAMGKSRSFDELCRSLSSNIPQEEARSRFLREVAPLHAGAGNRTAREDLPTVVSAPAAAAAPSISDAEIEQAQRELARHIGPIAKVLVKRALATTQTSPQLWATLATHIDSPADREAFLRNRPGG